MLQVSRDNSTGTPYTFTCGLSNPRLMQFFWSDNAAQKLFP